MTIIQKKANIQIMKTFGLLTCSILFIASFYQVKAEPSPQSRVVFIKEIEKKFAFVETPSTANNKLKISKPGWILVFEENSRKLLINGTTVWMNYPSIKLAGVWTISRIDLDKTITPIITGCHNRPLTENPRVLIDAGHDGKDNGAVSTPLIEKRTVLEIARRVQHKLNMNKVSSSLTRDKDAYLDLSYRASLTKKRKSDIFISIHLNSSPNPEASGIETYVMTPAGCLSTSGQTSDISAVAGNTYDEANIRFAYLIHQAVVQQTHTEDRGIKRGRFHVLKSVSCPAILIECGFVSCQKDKQRLLSDSYLDTLAEGISRGITKVINEITIKSQK